jgi:aromatic-amino-acid transaminase
LFAHLAPPEGDPILSLQDSYAADPRSGKINLSIGLYYDRHGKVPELASVRAARRHILDEGISPGYLPMAGAAPYREAVQELLFGPDHPAVMAGRVATVQTLGASGALRLGSDILKQCFPASTVWVSDPTWGNHHAIFEASGFVVQKYPYYDKIGRKADFAAMATCLGALPPDSIVLLHPCCHNPTGADLACAAWDELVGIFKRRQLIPFFDFAYQGYAEGVEEDSYAVHAFADAGIPLLVSNSFSKTFSLYGERCGGLSVVCGDEQEATRILGHMEMLIRRSYSNPPTFGSLIVSTVIRDPALRQAWEAEVGAMRGRIYAMRVALHASLSQLRPDLDLAFLLRQRGMFSYSGLDRDAVDLLRERDGIYLVDSGRLCLTGLNEANVDRVAKALAPLLDHGGR